MGGVDEEERIGMGCAFVVLGPECFGISSRRREGWCCGGGRDDGEKSEYGVEERMELTGVQNTEYELWREDGVQNPHNLRNKRSRFILPIMNGSGQGLVSFEICTHPTLPRFEFTIYVPALYPSRIVTTRPNPQVQNPFAQPWAIPCKSISNTWAASQYGCQVPTLYMF
ncbi:hypothetical protein TB1_033279 [Malus domestica]